MRAVPDASNTDQPWLVTHPLTSADATAVASMRATVGPMKGRLQGTAARPAFDEIMGHVPALAGVTYEAATVGGVPGWWCRPANARSEEAILHLHGGWYVWGSALAYRSFAGHIAGRAGVAAFVADYRLAPEHPFPAALEDARSCYRGLIDLGFRRVAIVGDSAGGGLALALMTMLAASRAPEGAHPVGAVALSPVTDLTLNGLSWETRAAAELYFVRPQAASLIQLYLGGHAPADPLASPLFGDLAGLPPIRVLVGEDELLLDDSCRYVERAVAAGVDARVDVWQGMGHVFPTSVGRLEAASHALESIGAFLAERLSAAGTATCRGREGGEMVSGTVLEKRGQEPIH